MKRKLYSFFIGGKRFHNEFQKQARLLITFTLGFTIAFTWRQSIFDISQSFVQFITKINNSSTSSILASIFITFVSIILIYISSHFLKENY